MVVGQFNYDRVQVGRASACLVLISLTDRQTRQAEACPTRQAGKAQPQLAKSNPHLPLAIDSGLRRGGAWGIRFATTRSIFSRIAMLLLECT